jgi:hypothetical protein
VSLHERLRTVCACLVLQLGVWLGVPVKADQVEELLRSLGQPKIAQTDPEETSRDGE